MSLPLSHPILPDAKIGILLINLGTPDGYDYFAMRRYLKEFLSDRRVIETHPFVWWIILNCFILTRRPQKSGQAYARIWNKKLNESPLRIITRAQCAKVEEYFTKKMNHAHIIVDWAMRYGTPSIKDRLDKMVAQGARRILLFALYPQYAAPTSATAYDCAFDALQKMRWQPAIRTMPPYHDDSLYIKILANSIKKHLASLTWQPQVIVTSYHGLPQSYFKKGDPYHCHCAKTTRLLREKMGMSDEQMRLTFQSRFGPEEWLTPYTDETLEQLAKTGIRKLAIVTPGFAADCLETLEEIALEGREIFMKHGGSHYSFIPCLNDDDAHIELLASLAERHLQGWL